MGRRILVLCVLLACCPGAGSAPFDEEKLLLEAQALSRGRGRGGPVPEGLGAA